MHSYVRQNLHVKRDEILADLTWEALCSYVSFVELNNNFKAVRRPLFKIRVIYCCMCPRTATNVNTGTPLAISTALFQVEKKSNKE